MLGRVGNQAGLVSLQRISAWHPKTPPWFWFKGHLKGDLRQGDKWLGRKILWTWASRAGLPVELSSTICPHPAPHQASVFLPSKWDGVSLPHLCQAQRGHRKAPWMKGSAQTHGKAQGGNLGRAGSLCIRELLGVLQVLQATMCNTPALFPGANTLSPLCKAPRDWGPEGEKTQGRLQPGQSDQVKTCPSPRRTARPLLLFLSRL